MLAGARNQSEIDFGCIVSSTTETRCSLTLTMLTPPRLITLDLSYLSLTKALPVAAVLLPLEGQILALVKPLFEVENSEARRTGRINDPLVVVAALERVIDAGRVCGLALQGVVKLALHPRHGVHEFFVSFVRCPGALSRSYDAQTLLARNLFHCAHENGTEPCLPGWGSKSRSAQFICSLWLALGQCYECFHVTEKAVPPESAEG